MSSSAWNRAFIGAAMMTVVWEAGAQAGTCSLLTWDSGSSLLARVSGPAVTECGGFVYVASGGSAPPPAGGDVALFQRYDPATETWTPLAPVLVPVAGATLACDAAGGRLFLFGGVDSSASVLALVQVYTIASNVWTQPGPALPSPRAAMGGGVIGGLVYLAGGFNSGFGVESQTWQFNPATGTYAIKQPLPFPRVRAASGVSGGRLYVMGGNQSNPGGALATNFVYDPIGDAWGTKADLLTAVDNPGGTALSAMAGCNGDIIVVGGGIPQPQATAITQIYDAANDAWAPGPPLPAARFGLRAAQAGDALIAVGGSADATNTVATVDLIKPVPVQLQSFQVE